jgi:hypothetical protein
MSNTCPGAQNNSDQVIQTLFLGASVLSYSVNIGWGGQPSVLNVELINDEQPAACEADNTSLFPNSSFGPDHYYTCVGDACYIDERGRTYSRNNRPPPLKKMRPGKLYFYFENGEIKSQYWKDGDPGFFGDYTYINKTGAYTKDLASSYDIIGSPVVFVLDSFVFAGIVQSWEKNPITRTYTVTIEGPDSLLENSWIILRDYGGSIFSSTGSSLGAPLPYIGPLAQNNGKIADGNIHNVFNVYGFLESFGVDYYGGSNATEDGIPYSSIIDALSVLTSIEGNQAAAVNILNNLNKRAFSPFGRILSKPIVDLDLSVATMGNFGVVPSQVDDLNINRSFYTLDLSELPILDNSFRMSGDVVSIMDFIRSLTAVSGKDFYTQLLPVSINGILHNIIKVKVIDRNIRPADNQISLTINSLKTAGYKVNVNSLGKEKSDSSSSKIMYVGAKQERLYQAKNYRLGFRQTAYVYDPALNKFVDFDFLNDLGKVRYPSPYSTRNTAISSSVNGTFATNVFNQIENIRLRIERVVPESIDNIWTDTEVGGSDQVKHWNYSPSIRANLVFNRLDKQNQRYIPIYMDTISPFFGYVMDDQANVNTGNASNNFRKIRPVWFDNLTGQLAVVIKTSELPPITLGSSSLFRTASLQTILPNGSVLITETEIRAAMSGFDSYFTYCDAKAVANKPQLYLMLLSAYYHANPAFANNRGGGVGWARGTNGSIIPFLPPENIFAEANVANNLGLPGNPQSAPTSIGWSALIDDNFIKDLMTICQFIANIGNSFYGKKYMVRIGGINSYRDTTAYLNGSTPYIINASTYLPNSTEQIAVFQGGGKIYFSSEPCDSAWEEPGNIIDDSFVVGGAAWYNLINEQGKIPPLLGYNASDNYDSEAMRLCLISKIMPGGVSRTTNANIAQSALSSLDPSASMPRTLGYNYSNFTYLGSFANQSTALKTDTSYGNMVRFFLTAGTGSCSKDKFIYPSINVSSLNKNDFVIVNTNSSRINAFGDTISPGNRNTILPPILQPNLQLAPVTNPQGMAKKLFVKAQADEMGFMDPLNLRDPRIILTSPGVELNPVSLIFSVDPTRTVLCNAAVEDLLVYLKAVPGPIQDKSFINHLLRQIRGYDAFSNVYLNPQGNALVGALFGGSWPAMAYNNNVTTQHAQIAPKAAHPYFAAIPMRLNQSCYGPWTNYPYLIRSEIFSDGITNQLASYNSELDYLNSQLNSPQLSNLDRKEIARSIKRIGQLINRANTARNNVSSGAAIENLVGGVKVQIEPDFVPWNYGGMAFLDKVVIGFINSNTDFRQILETAQIQINSAPIFGIGGEFMYTDPDSITGSIRFNNEAYQVNVIPLQYEDVKANPSSTPINIPIVGNPIYLPPIGGTTYTKINVTYNVITLLSQNRTGIAPIITNMSTRFDTSGFNTTYTFRSYARKLGLYSKQFSDRLKNSVQQSLQLNKTLFSLDSGIRNSKNILVQNRINERNNDRSSYSIESLRNSKLFGTSPTEVFIGSAQGYLPSVNIIENRISMAFANRTPNGMPNGVTTSPLSINGQDPGDIAVNPKDVGGLSKKYRHRSWVGMFQHWETKTELQEGYEEKAAMSLDGLLSPVSFYPTPNNSTYAMLPYPKINGRSMCPCCRGTHSVTQQVGIGNQLSNLTAPCPCCSRGMPSIVFAQNVPADIGSGVSGVNAMNLQPVVVPFPVWRNAHAQPPSSGERQRHSIRVVGRNWLAPFDARNGMSLDIDKNKEVLIDPLNNKIVENGAGVNKDFHVADIGMFHANGGFYLNNHRFFALRGPLMLHGWGYDISGYPVPNEADEPDPQTMISNLPKRFRLTVSGTNDYTQDGAVFATQAPYGLGDIIGKGWKFSDGSWTRTPSKYFHVNWGERPDLWPVGPIDLRWDANRRVWTAGGEGGCPEQLPPFIIADTDDPALLSEFTKLPKSECPYKLIYITLEEDMIKEPDYDETYPVRGFIDDIQYSKEPLPNKARRLVFVKDRSGYTAPRAAKLLCRYDKDTGFYEPVSKQSYFVFGTITGGNNAVVDLSYIQGKHRGSNFPTLNIVFDNTRFKMNISANSRGMFYYENGTWVLVAKNDN